MSEKHAVAECYQTGVKVVWLLLKMACACQKVVSLCHTVATRGAGEVFSQPGLLVKPQD
jgi:hypothetical protein